MDGKLAISVTVSGLSRIYGDALDGLLETARIADEAGLDQIAMPDHLAIGRHTDRYPYGKFPYPPEEPWLEPLTTLAAIAGATQRIRLATGVLIAPLRPPLLLAKTLATLDVLSAGRLDVGVGLGWQREEFEGAGVPFEGRGTRLDDTLRACRALWSEAPASFRSETVSFEELWCLPRPVQAGGVPLWFGVAPSERNVARIVEHGAGWMPLGSDPALLASGIERLREAFEKAGRDPAGLGVRANAPVVFEGRRPDLAATLEGTPALAALGVTVASFPLGLFVRSRDELGPFFERLATLRG